MVRLLSLVLVGEHLGHLVLVYDQTGCLFVRALEAFDFFHEILGHFYSVLEGILGDATLFLFKYTVMAV